MSSPYPLDPRLKNIDKELVEIVFEEFKHNINLVGVHLRDARNMLDGVQRVTDDRVLGKAALLLAAAALESNLTYLSGIALRIAEKRSGILLPPELRYLRGTEETINDNGDIINTPARQSLGQRLRIVPSLLARAIGRQYQLRPATASFKKLSRTIDRRDAIVHPRWNKYINEFGWWEAAEAIDAVELYLNAISSTLHPYLVGYFSVLYTIPGHDHHEVAVGHRTFGKKGPNRKISTMEEVGIPRVLTREWLDSHFLTHLALEHDCEGDSHGSMFTRAALVMLYAMLDAQLSVVAQWKMREAPEAFHEAEILFLNEYGVGLGRDGEVWIGDDYQSFKKRVKAVHAILSRRVDGKEEHVDLGRSWGKDLIAGQNLRNHVIHSSYGETRTPVSKQELVRSAQAVFAYFEELTKKLPVTFGYMNVLLKDDLTAGICNWHEGSSDAT